MLQVSDQIRCLHGDTVRRRQNPLRETTGIMHKQYEEFRKELQTELQSRCATQNWIGICDAKFKKFGRGVVSLQRIRKNDIIMDYHGKVVTGITFEEYADESDVAHEYCIEVADYPKRIIDATSETCRDHPGNRCLGRLANHVTQGSKHSDSENMKLADLLLDKLEPAVRVVVLKSRREIQPFEQLRYDYGDRLAKQLFTD